MPPRPHAPHPPFTAPFHALQWLTYCDCHFSGHVSAHDVVVELWSHEAVSNSAIGYCRVPLVQHTEDRTEPLQVPCPPFGPPPIRPSPLKQHGNRSAP